MSSCVSCSSRHSVPLPSPRWHFPPAGLVALPVSWRMTCAVMAEGPAQGFAEVQPAPAQPVRPSQPVQPVL